jgi:P-type E1-E2 ATPase
MFQHVEDEKIIYLKFADFIVNSIPSIVITFINFLYTLSLAKLNNTQNIISTASEKIAESSRLALICFDKTGTLTQKEVQFSQFIDLTIESLKTLSKESFEEKNIIKMIISSCHAIKELNGSLRGD